MSLETRFPRLLVATDFGPNDAGGGPALTRQLLKSYPAEKIFWWTYFQSGMSQPEPLANKPFVFPLSPKLLPHKRAARLKSWFLETCWSPLAARHLQRVTRQIRPDQIWCLPYRWSIPVLVQSKITSSFPSHVSVWDYPDSRAHCRILGSQRAARLMAGIDSLYRAAKTCDVISRPMQADMWRRTGTRNAFVVHSGLEDWQVESLRRTMPEASPTIRIAYAGTIVVPEVFELFLRALKALRSRLPRRLTLEFYGGRMQSQQPWFDPEWMTDHAHLEERAFHDELRRCSWGFLPMDLTDDDPRYNRFSFPNKFGTYLAAGLPVIVLAHRDSSAAEMLRSHPAGVFADTTSLPDLMALLEPLLLENDPKTRFRHEILRCAQTEFNMSAIREQLWRAFGVEAMSRSHEPRGL